MVLSTKILPSLVVTIACLVTPRCPSFPVEYFVELIELGIEIAAALATLVASSITL